MPKEAATPDEVLARSRAARTSAKLNNEVTRVLDGLFAGRIALAEGQQLTKAVKNVLREQLARIRDARARGAEPTLSFFEGPSRNPSATANRHGEVPPPSRAGCGSTAPVNADTYVAQRTDRSLLRGHGTPVMRWLLHLPRRPKLLSLLRAARTRLVKADGKVADLSDERLVSATREINQIADDIQASEVDRCRQVKQEPTAHELTGLLDDLEWIKSYLAEGTGRAPVPRELTTNLGRVTDDLNASIHKLRDIISSAQA